MRDICKRYGGVQALADASIKIYRGEVHALVGDNAAGKSTLIKIMSGAVPADSGTIEFAGTEVARSTARAPPSRSASRPSIRTWRWPIISTCLPTSFSVAS